MFICCFIILLFFGNQCFGCLHDLKQETHGPVAPYSFFEPPSKFTRRRETNNNVAGTFFRGKGRCYESEKDEVSGLIIMHPTIIYHLASGMGSVAEKEGIYVSQTSESVFRLSLSPQVPGAWHPKLVPRVYLHLHG